MSKTTRNRRQFTDAFKTQIVQLYLNGKKRCDSMEDYNAYTSTLDR